MYSAGYMIDSGNRIYNQKIFSFFEPVLVKHLDHDRPSLMSHKSCTRYKRAGFGKEENDHFWTALTYAMTWILWLDRQYET